MLKVRILTVLSTFFFWNSCHFDMFSSPVIEKDPNDVSIFVPLHRTFLFPFFILLLFSLYTVNMDASAILRDLIV